MNLRCKLSILETQVCPLSRLSRMLKARIQLRFEAWHADFFRSTNMQTGMKNASGVIRHENLHLPLWQRFDIKIGDPVFLILSFNGGTSLFVPFVNEQPLLRQAVASTRYRRLRGGSNEVAGGLLIARSKDDCGIGGGRHILLESTTNL